MSIITRNQLLDQYQAPVQISANGLFVDQNIYDQLLFVFATSPLKTIRAFRPYGIEIKDSRDLATLANLSTNRFDIKGVKMPDGKVYAFNVRATVKKILDAHEPAAANIIANAPIEFIP